MSALKLDRLLNKILELPTFMSVDLKDLRDSYLLLLGPRASATEAELSDYLLQELGKLKQRLLIQQYEYEDSPGSEARILVNERFYRCDKSLVEGPFEKRIRAGLDDQDLQNLRNREEDLEAKLAGKRGEIRECLTLTRELPALEKPLRTKHKKLMIQVSELEGRISLIRATIDDFSKGSSPHFERLEAI